MIAYDEFDGLNNQLMALRFACAVANLTSKTLLVKPNFTNHAQGIVKNEYRLETCSVVSCPSLPCKHRVESFHNDFTPCKSFACTIRNEHVFFPNKEVFRMGTSNGNLKRLMTRLSFPQLLLHPNLERKASLVLKDKAFDAIHVRQFSKTDYSLHKDVITPIPNLKNFVREVPLYVMTQNCSTLQMYDSRCLNSLLNETHSDMQCLLSQIIVSRARRFHPTPYSTVSQFVLRRRFNRDSSVRCNVNWCWTLKP